MTQWAQLLIDAINDPSLWEEVVKLIAKMAVPVK